MSRKKQFVTAMTTFSVALGIGFVMQYGDAVAARFQPESSTLTPAQVMPLQEATVMAVVPKPSMLLDIPVPQVADVQLASLDADLSEFAAPEMVIPQEAPIVVCDVVMDATVLPLAIVSLSIAAPCQSNVPVTVHHQGMMFSIMTDDAGLATTLVPVLSENAFFISEFADGDSATTSVNVPELAQFDRAALQWEGVEAVRLHALEFGATYDSEGHIWAAAAGELDFVNPPASGFLIELGDPGIPTPMLAEVYTFPSGTASQDGTVALSVEAEITDANCGQEIAAQSIQIDPVLGPNAIDLTMTMPNCDAIGEFLVLKNMFKDLTLAAK